MAKKFNVTGCCNSARHYMVDTAKRFKAVETLIDDGEYFTINRARQTFRKANATSNPIG